MLQRSEKNEIDGTCPCGYYDGSQNLNDELTTVTSVKDPVIRVAYRKRTIDKERYMSDTHQV